LLKPFFVNDGLEPELGAICAESLNVPSPLVKPDPARPLFNALELFHGPTGAFKDFGARFLMSCFDRMPQTGGPLTVLAATSGDTGAAVGCAAEERSSVRAIILFPKGRISEFQEHQLTCWTGGVEAIEVDGDFDQCQRLAKAAFADPSLTKEHRLTSANSINIGRLLPQLAYVAHAAMKVHAATGTKPGFIIPTGNLGHGFAVLLAKAIGSPIGPVVLATNANRTLKDWSSTGRYEARPSVLTLASAMDVGNPSNFERLATLPKDARVVRVELVTDDEIKARIRKDYEASGYVWCPHSTTAAEAWWRLTEGERSQRPWIAAATAHPYKFASIVNPLIGRKVDPSPALASIAGRERRKVKIDASLDALAQALGKCAAAA
jgi:threonine synthase